MYAKLPKAKPTTAEKPLQSEMRKVRNNKTKPKKG